VGGPSVPARQPVPSGPPGQPQLGSVTPLVMASAGPGIAVSAAMLSSGTSRGRVPKFLGVRKTDGKIQCTGKHGCGRRFDTKAEFAEHGTDSKRDNGHGLSYFKVCPAQDCYAAFQKHSTWQSHNSQSHSTGKIKHEFACQGGCGNVFSDRQTLNRHRERSGCGLGMSWFHQCPVCFKFFVNNYFRNRCVAGHQVGLPALEESEYRSSHPQGTYTNVPEAQRYGPAVALLPHHRIILTATQLALIASIQGKQ